MPKSFTQRGRHEVDPFNGPPLSSSHVSSLKRAMHCLNPDWPAPVGRPARGSDRGIAVTAAPRHVPQQPREPFSIPSLGP
eukprot:11958886-Alexandrium_andersonii.AAC.1